MKTINEKLEKLKNELKNRKVRIMIIGLGSVGNYLLDYLVSVADENMEICVVGRNENKMESDVNIVRVASLIRRQNRCQISIDSSVDLNSIELITKSIVAVRIQD